MMRMEQVKETRKTSMPPLVSLWRPGPNRLRPDSTPAPVTSQLISEKMMMTFRKTNSLGARTVLYRMKKAKETWAVWPQQCTARCAPTLL
jgi:hypothetical protein